MSLPTVLVNGWPVVLEMAEILRGPPEVVWDLITDWEHQDEWMLEASDFVVTSEMREGIGVTAEATIRIGGIVTRDVVEVVAWEPERRLSIDHRGWVSGRGTLDLTPLRGTRTHVFWTERLNPPLGLAGAVGLTGFKPVMRRIFKRDLGALAELVKARTDSQT